jgi:hypothetical protein
MIFMCVRVFCIPLAPTQIMESSFAGNVSNSTLLSELTFVSDVLTHLCPGNTDDAVRAAGDSHMSPTGLVFTASLAVAVLAVVPLVTRLLHYLRLLFFDRYRDGKVDADDFGACCCCKKWSARVSPQDAKEEDEEMGQLASKEAGEECDTVAQLQAKTVEMAAKAKDDGFLDKSETFTAFLGIVYACIFIYTALAYFSRLALSGDALCQAGQIVLFPLFKPAALPWSFNFCLSFFLFSINAGDLWQATNLNRFSSLSLSSLSPLFFSTMRAAKIITYRWPALMRLVHMVHWQQVQSISETCPDIYATVISPGTQPFQFNLLSLTHATLMGLCLVVYILCALCFLPLTVVFGLFLVPTLFLLVFVVMYVPTMCLSGKFCCSLPILCRAKVTTSFPHTRAPTHANARRQIHTHTTHAHTHKNTQAYAHTHTHRHARTQHRGPARDTATAGSAGAKQVFISFSLLL